MKKYRQERVQRMCVSLLASASNLSHISTNQPAGFSIRISWAYGTQVAGNSERCLSAGGAYSNKGALLACKGGGMVMGFVSSFISVGIAWFLSCFKIECMWYQFCNSETWIEMRSQIYIYALLRLIAMICFSRVPYLHLPTLKINTNQLVYGIRFLWRIFRCKVIILLTSTMGSAPTVSKILSEYAITLHFAASCRIRPLKL